MTIIASRDLKLPQLAAMLRAWGEGDYAVEAAVELLIAHETWLARGDFRARLIDAIDDGWSRHGLIPMASIDWPAVRQFVQDVPASSSEVAVLRIAASLGGADTGSLSGLTSGLDPTNTELVLQALAHRAGWHERHRQALITGDFPGRSANASSTPGAGAAPEALQTRRTR